MRNRLCWATAFVFLAIVPVSAGADATSLYQGPGPRPGPDILYEPVADAPQLQNTGSWSADPILVSGATAYRGGEFLYQDFLYDDTGARGNQVQNDPRAQGNSFSRPAGTYLYPTNTAVYGNNAADLVELRVEPRPAETAFRLTLNTIKDSSVVGATIAIGGTPGVLRTWPYNANVRSPAQYFLTVHGTSTPGAVAADLRDAVTGTTVGVAPTASLDTTRRQVTVSVPHSSWDPTGQVVRLAAGVGLWNTATSAYRVPGQNPTATQPGGAPLLGSAPALFNLAFRTDCQQEDPLPPGSVPPGCEPTPNVQHPNALSNPSWWREHSQARVLGSGTALQTPDISEFFANVDFNMLAAAVDDDSGVPQTGPMNRILASHSESEQGAVYTGSCNTGGSTSTNGCIGWLRGQLQPYAIYVPQQPMPSGGYGMTLLLHSLGANYNQFQSSSNQSQFGERGPGSIVITPAGRGPDGWYYGYAAADTFEVWADVAARYQLDPEWTAIAGYSMGGYGTYKFATQFPDLFAKAQPTVGPPGQGIWAPPADPQPGGARSNTNRMLASLRNIPFLIWNAAQDELVPVASAQAQADAFDSLAYRYEFDLYNPADHFALALNDSYAPAAAFLGTTEVDRDPPHVTHAYNPTMDFADGDLKADHAYWLSDITLRNGSGSAPLGTIDVRSHGFGVADPTASSTQTGAGVLTGGQAPMPYTSQTRTWGAAPSAPLANQLDIDATNVSAVTINARRARVGCDAQLEITSDGPIDVNLVDCPTGTIEVKKDLIPNDDPGRFDLQIDGTTHVSDAGDEDSTGPIEVPTGNHSVSETAGTDTSLSAYSSSISCTRNGNPAESGSGDILEGIVVGTDDTVVCTITNNRRAIQRPLSANKVSVSLVPAYQECESPNRLHGPPLDSGSCTPPQQVSGLLKVGATNRSVGNVRFAAVTGDPETTEDEADVKVNSSLTDVRVNADSSDYAGELTIAFVARLTDRQGPATVSDFTFAVPAHCASTPGPEAGACSASTTFEAVLPGVVVEEDRAIWEVGTVEVLDGAGDPIARQGVFVP
jgi:dienelactone hydrolase